jgi:hypothetical protein
MSVRSLFVTSNSIYFCGAVPAGSIANSMSGVAWLPKPTSYSSAAFVPPRSLSFFQLVTARPTSVTSKIETYTAKSP